MPDTKKREILKLHRIVEFGEVSKPRAIPQRIEVKPFFEASAEHDAIPPIKGVAADSAQAERRGGAHNRADRESSALNVQQVGNLLAAAAHAMCIGLPLNRMVTIHWESAGVAPEDMAKATGRFLDLMAKAFARHGARTACVWVHENGQSKGGHCHALIHVPPDLGKLISSSQRRWLRAITGMPYKSKVILGRPIGGSADLAETNPPLYAENLLAALRYILKGADQTAAQHFDLRLLEPGGQILGKRCGTSQNLGRKAREGLATRQLKGRHVVETSEAEVASKTSLLAEPGARSTLKLDPSPASNSAWIAAFPLPPAASAVVAGPPSANLVIACVGCRWRFGIPSPSAPRFTSRAQ